MNRKLVSSPKLQRFAWRQYLLPQYSFSIEKVARKDYSLLVALIREMNMMTNNPRPWEAWPLKTPLQECNGAKPSDIYILSKPVHLLLYVLNMYQLTFVFGHAS